MAQLKNSSNKKKTILWQLWSIFLIPTLGVGLATWMYYTHSLIPALKTNKGTLMVPSPHINDWQIKQTSPKTALFSISKTQPHWSLLFLPPHTPCDKNECQQYFSALENVHIALNKDYRRVHRYVLTHKDNLQQTDFLLTNQKDQKVQRLIIDRETLKEATKQLGIDINQVSLFLVDPHGNIMMYYQKNQIGKPLLKDLQKLLRINSQDKVVRKN